MIAVSIASMRPAQLTPENVWYGGSQYMTGGASMRPAQLTPENKWKDDDKWVKLPELQ